MKVSADQLNIVLAAGGARQAGADVSVTPEMRRAGAAALDLSSGSLSEEAIAEAVYIAMRRLEPYRASAAG